jgi:predicted HTH transcriptional regulator
MRLFELHEIIEKGENGTVEFKRKFSSPWKIAKEMIAFANTKGGYLIFGIDDDRSVVGVESEKGEIELIDMAAKFFCEPEIDYKTDILPIYRKDVVVVEVPESRKKPHVLVEDGKDGTDPYRAYIRYRDKSVLASKETVRILRKSHPDSPPLILNLTDKERALLDYLGIHEKITMKEFKEMLNISNRRASRILVNLVRAELIIQHNTDKEDFYTLS